MKDIEIIDFLLERREFLSTIKVSPVEISAEFKENAIHRDLLDEITNNVNRDWYILDKRIYIER